MATTALVMTPKAEAQQASLTTWQLRLFAVSGNGHVFAGNFNDQAYIGDMDGHMRAIEGAGYSSMEALAMSRAGNVVVGQGFRDSTYQAWRYVGNARSGTTTELGTLAPTIASAHSYARGVSDAGDRVVGHSRWQGNTRGFVWIEGATGGVEGNEQMYRLDGLVGGYGTNSAYGISGNGRYAVGWSDAAGTTQIATRWNLTPIDSGGAATIENLGSLTGMTGISIAEAASHDGSVVVGSSEIADNWSRAFRWREGATNGAADNPQMLDLGTLGGRSSYAEAVSADGRWVVGGAQDAANRDLAFRWSEETGMESIEDWLGRQGVFTDGYTLVEAVGVSDDGTVVVGYMENEQGYWGGYLARGAVDGPGGNPGGLMKIEEYHASLYSAAGIANTGEFLTWLPMNGAHHRPLMLTPDLSGDMCAWATGDFAHHGGSSTGLALAEIGACTDLAGGSVRIGGAVGTAGSWQDLALGGSARMQGQYVLSEIDWQPDGTPLLLSLTGMLGGYQAHIERAYSNGAATAVSSGETGAVGGVVRLRADWLEAARIGNTSINPYASLGFGGLRVDGYSESGGPFPAVFDAQTLGHADIRLGVTAVTEFSTQTKLSTTLEVAHRTGTAPQASGNVDGLFDFSLGGGSYSQTWARTGFELDHAVNDHLALSTSAHLATNGRDPSIAASFGIKGSF